MNSAATASERVSAELRSPSGLPLSKELPRMGAPLSWNLMAVSGVPSAATQSEMSDSSPAIISQRVVAVLEANEQLRVCPQYG